jgi:hypothetical protein
MAAWAFPAGGALQYLEQILTTSAESLRRGGRRANAKGAGRDQLSNGMRALISLRDTPLNSLARSS